MTSSRLLCSLIFCIMSLADGSGLTSWTENGVVGEPQIFCGPEGIHVLLRTRAPFRGRLFVQDELDRAECVHSYLEAKEADSTAVEFHLKFGACNMRRQRTLSPRGVSFNFVLVVSFHHLFLTGADRAFNVRCFFVEAVKAVESHLDVNALSTETIQQEFTLPQCNYNLRHQSHGGSLKFVSVGDAVTHVWECDTGAAWLYGLLIHSCYVDDGRGNRCATDHMLLQDIVYDTDGMNAYVDSHVFKYADRVQLFFTCTVQLCFKQDGGCDGITPPACGGDASRHHPPDNHHHAAPHPPPGLHRKVQERQRHVEDLFKSIPSHSRVFVPPPPPNLSPRLKDDPNFKETKGVVQFIHMNETVELDEADLELNDTIGSKSRSSRDIFNFMETDLTTELTVMPLDEVSAGNLTVARNTISPLDYESGPVYCLTRWSVVGMVIAAVILVMGSATTVAYCAYKRRTSQSFTRKIYLTE